MVRNLYLRTSDGLFMGNRFHINQHLIGKGENAKTRNTTIHVEGMVQRKQEADRDVRL